MQTSHKMHHVLAKDAQPKSNREQTQTQMEGYFTK